MKKKSLALLIGASVVLLAGCTTTKTITEIEIQKQTQTRIETHTETRTETHTDVTEEERADQPDTSTSTGTIGETVRIAPESIDVSFYSSTLYVGETKQIEATVRPIQASKTPVEFASSDSSIVSVSADGLLTAVGEGEAVISVTVQGTNIIQQIKVASFNKITENVKTAIGTEIAAMATKQEQKFPNGLSKVLCTRFLDRQRYSYKKKSDYDSGAAGTLIYSSFGVEKYLVDKEAGYFYIGGYDDNIIIEGATKQREYFDWMFKTNESYITRIYHIAGSSKTYLTVDTSSYIGQETFRAVEDILDCIFRSGKELAKNPIDWALSTSALTTRFEQYSSLIVSAGKMNNGELVNYVLQQNDYHYTEAAVDESDDEIPAGTAITQDYFERLTWKDGYVYSYEVGINSRYTTNNLITGASEYIVENLTISFDIRVNDDVHYEEPNKDDYTEVADIYDLQS